MNSNSWITGVEGDHYTADQGCVRLFGGKSLVFGRGLSLYTAYKLYARTVTQKRRCSRGISPGAKAQEK